MAVARVESEADKEYSEKSTRHMFRQNLYMGLAASTFLGVLGSVVAMVIKSFSIEAATAAAAPATAGFLGLTPVGWAVIGGMMALGVASTYMAQVEATRLKEVQDDRLAQKNADCLVKGHGHALAPMGVEYAQNRRADGKAWQDVTKQPRTGIQHQMQ